MIYYVDDHDLTEEWMVTFQDQGTLNYINILYVYIYTFIYKLYIYMYVLLIYLLFLS